MAAANAAELNASVERVKSPGVNMRQSSLKKQVSSARRRWAADARIHSAKNGRCRITRYKVSPKTNHFSFASSE